MLAPSAYLASAAGTADLINRLLPSHLCDIKDKRYGDVVMTWLSVAQQQELPLVLTQRILDDKCCKTSADYLYDLTTDNTEQARLLASRACGSGDWLNALPLPGIGLKLDDASVRIAAGLRLGAPLVLPHKCVCDTMVSADGRHGLSCRKSAGRQSRHSEINEILLKAFISAGVLSTREPTGLITHNGKRPDGVTSVPWKKGRCLAWDATCPDTYAQSHINATCRTVGAAAASAELNKHNKYTDLSSSIDFVPVAIETTGVWGEEGSNLISELGRRVSVVKAEPRSTQFLRQRISVAIQRGNAACILATVPRVILS